MLPEDKYFQTLTQDELWQRYCGFLDLSINEFMEIQKELLMDEIERVADSLLGKKIMNNQKPKTVEEFRQMVPLTTYDDYEPYLGERQEDALAEKPYLWCHSAGRGGDFKWIPYSSGFIERAIRRTLGGFILASTRQKGRVNISPGFRFLSILPPAPYATGSVFQILAQHYFSTQIIPPLETSETMEFHERIQRGFQISLREGVDIIASIASVLVKMGEAFSEQAQGTKFSPYMLHPKIVGRLLQAWLRSKREKRPILPKDLWPARAILTGGVDTVIYRDDITHYWGGELLEFYGSTEVGLFAMQAWNKKAMTFSPDNAFLEFIPEEERLKHMDDKGYQPPTVLLNQVQEGKLYEVVITHFYGMPLLRYPLRDLIKVVALRDDEVGVNLPQIVFQRRVGETINLGSLAELDEKTIWRAIANTGIKYTDWSACKDYERNQSFLHLYLELKEEKEAVEIAAMIDEQLKSIDVDYRDIDSYLQLQPVRVTLLSPGTFQHYMEEKRKEGADLAHLKPVHINPAEAVIERLLQLSEVATEK